MVPAVGRRSRRLGPVSLWALKGNTVGRKYHYTMEVNCELIFSFETCFYLFRRPKRRPSVIQTVVLFIFMEGEHAHNLNMFIYVALLLFRFALQRRTSCFQM